ncbi:MAG: sodium ion-translocating decarboxylase subunit beta [Peptococcaceae bacterium]|nr:MAG: sodium ion-translocating decarboxylase subunit beta [Peptococcaceae bacterium]
MNIQVWDIFQGVATLFTVEPKIAVARIVLIALGFLLIYLGYKKILEPILMIPMGLGMLAVNAGVLFLSAAKTGTIFLDPLISDSSELVNIMQVDFLQPIYTLTFSNGLIACLVFMGIGAITDMGFLLARPFASMTLAIFAELGTIAVLPIAVAFGFNIREAAAIAIVGGADAPMVLYTSLILAKHLFVPITIVAYLYLSLTYAGYPYLIKMLVPEEMRGIKMDNSSLPEISPGEKFAFAVIACTVLSFLFPVAAPLFVSFFLGVAVKEAGIKQYVEFLEGPVLYGSTFFLGLLLGVLLQAETILDPRVLTILVLGMMALLLSGIGGLLGGLLMYALYKGKFNPVIGIAGVSCVPTTAKVAQKSVYEVNKWAVILPYAMGANVCGVITSAIITGIYVTVIPVLKF